MALRSTKAASKVRRAAMATELASLRRILPISQTAIRELSQIQLMSIATAYIAKSTHLSPLISQAETSSFDAMSYNFEEALFGFIMATTARGRLLYISENVVKYLGYSTMDLLTHNDTVYDITNPRDHVKLRSIFDRSSSLHSAASSGPVSTTCCFTMARSFRRQAGSRRNKELKVLGRFAKVEQTELTGGKSYELFIAVCYSDVIVPSSSRVSASTAAIECYNTLTFHSLHGLDMKYINIEANGESHLGFNRGGLHGRSWYERMHPDDVENARRKHQELITQLVIRESTCSLSVRLQTQLGYYIAVRMDMRLHKNTSRPTTKQARLARLSTNEVVIHVTNHVLDECTTRAAFKLRSTLSDGLTSDTAFSVSPSTLIRSHGSLKRKMAENGSECPHSDVDKPARTPKPPVCGVNAEAAPVVTPQEQGPELITKALSRTDGLLASRMMSQPAVVHREEISRRALTAHPVVPYEKFITVPASPIDDRSPAEIGFTSTFDVVSWMSATSQLTPDNAESTATQSPQMASYYEEFWTSPDSTQYPVDSFDSTDTYVTSSSCHSHPDQCYSSPDDIDPVCGMPMGDEKVISSILSDMDERELNKIMEDFDIQANTCGMVSSSVDGLSKRMVPVVIEKSPPIDGFQSSVSVVTNQDGGVLEGTTTVTNSVCGYGQPSSEVNRSGGSERIRDLLAVYQKVITLTISELVKNHAISRLGQLNSTGMVHATASPNGLSQLIQIMGNLDSLASSSNVLMKALALNDVTAELLRILNKSDGGGNVTSLPPQTVNGYKQAY